MRWLSLKYEIRACEENKNESLWRDCDDFDSSKNIWNTYYQDKDGDGYTVGFWQYLCEEGEIVWYTRNENRLDCNDLNKDVYQSTYVYEDKDDDGYWNESTGNYICSWIGIPNNFVDWSLWFDCDDTDSAIGHGENLIEERVTLFRDNDGDGYWDRGARYYMTVYECLRRQPLLEWYVSNNLDCNDNDPSVYEWEFYYLDRDGDWHGTQSCKVERFLHASKS